eukprot:CAMPEP_0178436260 /NCGR_PEP_ID=MMETSP0689_2-20121128/34349_1 /TAXON_ID=160604 /ORGANISM="Amphidinium massartii, Strain CS-259" /LENGTH=139 /DNA_ID=CAMNT_0020058353 /DNA_START=1173 /DNA_END=1592 /DNA_ORIENTATION=-
MLPAKLTSRGASASLANRLHSKARAIFLSSADDVSRLKSGTSLSSKSSGKLSGKMPRLPDWLNASNFLNFNLDRARSASASAWSASSRHRIMPDKQSTMGLQGCSESSSASGKFSASSSASFANDSTQARRLWDPSQNP